MRVSTDADADAGEPQPPLIPDDTRCLSLTSYLRLPKDKANGFDLILGFLNFGLGNDSTNGDVFDLDSSSMAHPSIKNDASFNPYSPSKKLRIS